MQFLIEVLYMNKSWPNFTLLIQEKIEHVRHNFFFIDSEFTGLARSFPSSREILLYYMKTLVIKRLFALIFF
jgi:hypothetical protein